MKKDHDMPMPERMPPTLMLNEDDLPEITKWRVGKKYTILLEVEQTSSSKGDGMMGGGKKMEARFRVLSAKSSDEPVSEEKEEQDEKKQNPAITRAVRSKLKSY